MDIKKTIQAIREIIQTSRPVSWVNTAAPFAAGYLIVAGQMGPSFWIGLIYFLFPYNLLMYGVNDIYDYESDLKNPRKNSIEGALLNKSRHKMIWYAIAAANIPFIIAMLILAPTIAAKLFFLLLVGFCFSYSMPPMRFKEIPVVDSLNSSLHFVSPLLFGLLLAGVANIVPYLMALGAFLLWGMASQALGAIQDIKPDRAAGIASIATVLGARRTNRFVMVLYTLSAVLVAVGYFPVGIVGAALLSLYVLNASFFVKYISDARSGQFHRAWQNFIWLNQLVGFGLTLLLLWSYNVLGFQTNWLMLLSYGLIGLSIIGLLTMASNTWLMRVKRQQSHPHHWPRVSILLSCYNQSATITSTLLAALGQDYPDYELLVSDLGSTDATASRLQAQQDKRLRVIDLDTMPPGWQIQNWALEQLRLKAHGEILVILHQDVLLYPAALSTLVAQLSTNSVDFVSVQAGDPTKQLNHQLSLAQTCALQLGWYPELIRKLLRRDVNIWLGQITVCQAGQLDKIHGFKNFKASPIGNLEIQRAATKRGLKSIQVLGNNIASSHFHQEVIASTQYLSQQAYPQYYQSLPLVVLICFIILVVGLLPILLFAWQFIVLGGMEAWLLLGAVSIYYLQRLISAITLKQHLIGVALFPIADLIVVWCIVRSMLETEFSTPRWHNSLNR
jgi:4-hydroxybenzoate polyprenyltransferase